MLSFFNTNKCDKPGIRRSTPCLPREEAAPSRTFPRVVAAVMILAAVAVSSGTSAAAGSGSCYGCPSACGSAEAAASCGGTSGPPGSAAGGGARWGYGSSGRGEGCEWSSVMLFCVAISPFGLLTSDIFPGCLLVLLGVCLSLFDCREMAIGERRKCGTDWAVKDS